MKKGTNTLQLFSRLMLASTWVLMLVPPAVHAEDPPLNRQQMLEQTDKNHDGRIDRAERSFARADRNHDGTLNDAEKAARKEHLSRIDKNNDGISARANARSTGPTAIMTATSARSNATPRSVTARTARSSPV